MAMGGSSRRGAIKSAINITPLVDVVLVLLIIFMVVTPLMTPGRSVQLPVATRGEIDPKASVVLSLTADRALYLDQERIGDAAQAERELRARLQGAPGLHVSVKADRSLRCRDVSAVLALARRAGAGGAGLTISREERR